MRNSILLAAAVAALSGCGASGDEAGQGTAQAKTPAAEAKAEAASAGEWRRVERDGFSALLFGPTRDRPLAGLRCDSELELLLIERMTTEPEAGVDAMEVSAGGKTVRLPVMWDGASLPIAGASVRLEDPLMDRLSGLGGPIELKLKGEPTLTMPPDRRIGTLIEECRQA